MVMRLGHVRSPNFCAAGDDFVLLAAPRCVLAMRREQAVLAHHPSHGGGLRDASKSQLFP